MRCMGAKIPAPINYNDYWKDGRDNLLKKLKKLDHCKGLVILFVSVWAQFLLLHVILSLLIFLVVNHNVARCILRPSPTIVMEADAGIMGALECQISPPCRRLNHLYLPFLRWIAIYLPIKQFHFSSPSFSWCSGTKNIVKNYVLYIWCFANRRRRRKSTQGYWCEDKYRTFYDNELASRYSSNPSHRRRTLSTR
jgi:hypothetical protein